MRWRWQAHGWEGIDRIPALLDAPNDLKGESTKTHRPAAAPAIHLATGKLGSPRSVRQGQCHVQVCMKPSVDFLFPLQSPEQQRAGPV